MRSPEEESTQRAGAFEQEEGNAFANAFIKRFDRRETPPHTYTSLTSGPWRVEPLEPLESAPESQAGNEGTRWVCLATGESAPAASVNDRSLALVIAAALPAASQPARFKLRRDSRNPAVLLQGETPTGTLRWIDEELVAAVNVLAALLEAPNSLAYLLEAAGAPVLERTGRILAERTEMPRSHKS